jgi:hypothetical protein
MNRRSFVKNTIGALLWACLPYNKALAKLVENTSSKSLDVLLYVIQTKSGDWKVRATKWTDLNKEKLRYSHYNIETFKPLTIIDNSDVRFFQKKYVEQYKAVNSLHSVDHYQCMINGINYAVSKQATFESRSRGGKTNVRNNHIQTLGKEWGSICGKKYGKSNIKNTHTTYARLAQRNSASYIFEQFKDDGTVVKTWKGKLSFKNSDYTFASVRNHCYFGTKYKGYNWRIKKSTNKNHRSSVWNKETIKKAAKECSYKAEFKQKYQQAYRMSKRLCIFEDVTKHMKRPKAKNQYTKYLVVS